MLFFNFVKSVLTGSRTDPRTDQTTPSPMLPITEPLQELNFNTAKGNQEVVPQSDHKEPPSPLVPLPEALQVLNFGHDVRDQVANIVKETHQLILDFKEKPSDDLFDQVQKSLGETTTKIIALVQQQVFSEKLKTFIAQDEAIYTDIA